MLRSLRLLATIMTGAFAANAPISSSGVTLDVPPPFRTKMSIEHFQMGDEVLHIDWITNRAIAPMTRYKGFWGPETGDTADDHPWTIDVYDMASPKVEAAYAHAKNGYEAGLDEWIEFLLPPSKSPPPFVAPVNKARAYLFARYRQMHFRWGNAVSFLSQATQDTGAYVAHNGHLTYEVWGFTKDRQHVVVGWFRVSHPELPDWGEGVPQIAGIREDSPDLSYQIIDAENHHDSKRITKLYQEMARTAERAVEKDPKTKLIEKCRPNEFQPSLSAVDSFINSLQMN